MKDILTFILENKSKKFNVPKYKIIESDNAKLNLSYEDLITLVKQLIKGKGVRSIEKYLNEAITEQFKDLTWDAFKENQYNDFDDPIEKLFSKMFTEDIDYLSYAEYDKDLTDEVSIFGMTSKNNHRVIILSLDPEEDGPWFFISK